LISEGTEWLPPRQRCRRSECDEEAINEETIIREGIAQRVKEVAGLRSVQRQKQKGNIMARYITLIRFTEQGARGIRQSAGRALAFKKAAEKAGLNVETQLWTAGSCDGLLILSGDEQKVLRQIAELARLGNVRTETLRAFDPTEFRAITG
jgi:uncharacterized protein with GYD domain